MKKNKKKKREKKQGLSLIELICIIIIVSLLVTMSILVVYRIMSEASANNKLAQEEEINNACESYIFNNRDKAPKTIGDTVNISLKTLKDNNYIREDIYNSNKESCMNESYVRVYKLNTKEYTYLPYLYCGKEKKKDVEDLPTPTVNILFIDGKEVNNNNLIFNNIKESRIYIEMIGGEDFFGRQIEMDNYEITISVRTKDNPQLVEEYSSGVINANKRTTYTIDKKIMNYINASKATSINVVVKVTNTLGGVSEAISIAQADNKEN